MRLPRVRFTVRRLMVIVAVVGVLLWVWLYHRENASIDRSLTAIHLRASREATRRSDEWLSRNLPAGPGPMTAPASCRALAAGMADGDWRVRLAAAQDALGVVGRGWVWNGASGEDIDLAIRALIRAVDDTRTDVRIEATRSLGSPLHRRENAESEPWTPSGRGDVRGGGTAGGRLTPATDDRLRPRDPYRLGLCFQPGRICRRQGPDPLVGIMISDPVRDVRTAASLALPTGWSTLRELYSPLLDHLKEVRSIEERSAIGWAIADLPPTHESIPDLIEALSLDNRALKTTIPTVMAKLGKAARPALPALRAKPPSVSSRTRAPRPWKRRRRSSRSTATLPRPRPSSSRS